MHELAALAAFSFVTSVTPGPNNVLLWASGLRFGFRATVPHVIGTSIGIGSLAVATSAGIGILVTALPGVALALRIIGSAYLLYLAYQVAMSGAMQRAEVSRPLGIGQATAFQWVNPKAWFFALAAVSTFLPADLPILLGGALLTVTMMIVVLPAASIWAAGGTALNRLTADAASGRTVSVGLGLALVATVTYLWI